MALSHNTTFQFLDVDDGLSQNSVVDIIQDSYGFIWIATQDGLNRYDGKNFVYFEKYFNDITKFDYSKLGRLYVDEDDKLWLTLSNGSLEYMDPNTNDFRLVPEIPEASCLLQVDVDTHWIGTFGSGLFNLVNGNTQFDKRIPPQSIYNIRKFSDGKIGIAAERGFYLYDGYEFFFYPIPGGYQVSDVLPDESGTIWISTFGGGMYQFNQENEKIEQFHGIDIDANIEEIWIDDEGRFWAATFGKGIFTFHLNDRVVRQFSQDPKDKSSLGYDDVLCIFQDDSGTLWFGTDGAGLALTGQVPKKFNKLVQSQVKSGIQVDIVRSIFAYDDGRTWMGTWGKGLVYFNRESGELFNYYADDRKESLSNNRVISLAMDGENDLWLSVQEGGIDILIESEQNKDPDGAHFQHKAIGLKDNTIYDMLPESRTSMWLACRYTGLTLFDKNKGILKQFLAERGNSTAIPSNFIQVIEPGPNGTLFLGTENSGVVIFDKESETFKSIESLANKQTLSSKQIKSLNFIEPLLWIGTQNGGLNCYHTETGKITAFRREQGLPNNVVYAVLNDDENDLWISTNRGICEIKPIISKELLPQDIDVHCFDVFDGLQGMEFNTGAYFRSESGTLFFGGLNGINWINPTDISLDENTVNVMINEVMVNNRPFIMDTVPFAKKHVKLKHKQNAISFMYRALDYSLSNNNRYEYRLDGYRDEWIDADKLTMASFTNLSPGEYRFDVRASNHDGVMNEAYSSFTFEIVPAVWQTWWFRILMALAIATIIVKVVKWRTARLKEELALQRKVNALESQTLRSQMNPHFLFNGMNSIMHYLVNKGRYEAADYLTKFSKLIRLFLENNREGELTLRKELEALKLYMEVEQRRFEDGFEFSVDVDPEIDIERFVIPPMIIQPFVENAIWHGLLHKNSNRKISLSLDKSNEGILVSVKDNGIGRAKAEELGRRQKHKRKSLGMQITASRISLLNEVHSSDYNVEIIDLLNEDGSAAGTEVRIKLRSLKKTAAA